MNLTHIKYIIVAMLVMAILPWPYEYYKLLRLVLFVMSLFFAYGFHKYGHEQWEITILIGVALIYNPVLTIHLPKELWIIVNLVTAWLYLFMLKLPRKQLETKRKLDSTKIKGSIK